MSFEACAALVQKGDPNRFACAMTAAPHQRDGLFALYAFNLEVSRAPWVTQEPMIAEMRLQWWLDAIAEIYTDKPIRRHDVVLPLAETIKAYDLPRAEFDNLIEVRQWDIYRQAHEDETALLDYIRHSYAGLMQVACKTLGDQPSGLEGYALGCGIAVYLKAVNALERQGRIPLIDGTPDGIARLAAFGLQKYKLGRSALATAPVSILPALRSGLGAGALLKAVEADPQLILAEGIQQNPIMQKIRLMWSFASKKI